MPYIIAIVAIAIAAIAFTMLRSEPAIEPDTTATTEEVRLPEESTTDTDALELDAEASATMPISDEEPDISVVSEIVTDTPEAPTTETSFADGSYTTQASYFTPRRTEHLMDITLTVENDVVTDASIIWDGDATPKTPSHSGFDVAYKAEVVGQPLSEINLSRVGGASLTSDAFNEAVDTIEAEARTS